jgi:hypothetical protein
LPVAGGKSGDDHLVGLLGAFEEGFGGEGVIGAGNGPQTLGQFGIILRSLLYFCFDLARAKLVI